MNDSEQTGQENGSSGGIPMSSKSYNFLLSLSKKLGNVATKSFVEVREFLNQDVPLPTGERFLSNVSLLRRRHTGSNNSDQHNGTGQKDKKAAANKGETEVDPTEKLKKIVKQSQEVLASANTVFPVTLFPDTVFVDRTKVTIIRRNFFWSEDVMSIRIQDVLNVSASVGPLFGSLTIVSRVMSTVDHFQINYFWRSDAAHLKHIIQGYVIAQHNKLDTAHLEKGELINTLEELGHDSNAGI